MPFRYGKHITQDLFPIGTIVYLDPKIPQNIETPFRSEIGKPMKVVEKVSWKYLKVKFQDGRTELAFAWRFLRKPKEPKWRM